MKRIGHLLQTAYRRLMFYLSSNDHWLYKRIYLGFYRPQPGSLSDFLDRYSRSRENFFVLQVGANDGMTHDPIHKFIKRDRWSGLLLEPQPYVYDRYLIHTYKKHENIRVVNAAVGPKDGKAKLYGLSFSDERWATGLARFDREGLIEMLHSGRLDGRLKKGGIKLSDDPSEWIREIEIEVRSPDSLLAEYGISQIDLLMIDTEGFDYEVIMMFDLKRIKPGAIVFEDMHLSSADYQSCCRLLHDSGYATHPLGPNTIAWQPELEPVIPWK